MTSQICDLGFCGVSEGCTPRIPSISGDTVKSLVSGLEPTQGCRCANGLQMPACGSSVRDAAGHDPPEHAGSWRALKLESMR